MLKLARKHGGVFVLRIEDTDRERTVPGAAEAVETALAWAGIHPDESPQRGGQHGPYVQSQRLQLYHKHVHDLIDNKQAYRCFCSPERLETLRSIARKKGLATSYDGACRSISPADAAALAAANKPHTVRLRVPDKGHVDFQDVVYGDVRFECKTIDEQVLLKVSKGGAGEGGRDGQNRIELSKSPTPQHPH